MYEQEEKIAYKLHQHNFGQCVCFSKLKMAVVKRQTEEHDDDDEVKPKCMRRWASLRARVSGVKFLSVAFSRVPLKELKAIYGRQSES